MIKSAPDNSIICGISKTRIYPYFNNRVQNSFVDIKQVKSLNSILMEFKPDVVIHCAAEGNVDTLQGKIEIHKDLNLDVSKRLLMYTMKTHTKFVYISSNAVFGGMRDEYDDYSTLDPINDYGILKAENEKIIGALDETALMVRPILMYGWPNLGRRLNPIASWIKKLREGHSIKVVDDIWTQPLAAWDCAKTIWRGIDIDARGPVNVSGGQTMTLHELALCTAEIFNLDRALVIPVKSSEFPNIAPRPVKTRFNLNRVKSEFKLSTLPPIKGLAELKKTEFDFNL